MVSIPFDVMCSIIERVDFNTLKMMTLVSRDHKYEADKHLWRTFTISIPGHLVGEAALARLEDASKVLSRDNRASRITQLKLGIDARLGTRKDPKPQASMKLLFASLQHAVHLESLVIEAEEFSTTFHILQALSSRVILAPYLSRLHLTAPCYNLLGAVPDNFACFWAQHPRIRRIELHTSASLPPASLSSLDELHIPSADEAALMQGNPVTDLTITSFMEYMTSSFLENARMATAPLRRLRIESVLEPTSYSSMIRHMSHLQTLIVRQRRWRTRAERDMALQALISLQHLERYEVDCAEFGGDPDFEEEFLKGTMDNCRSLRTAVFTTNDFKNVSQYGARIFTRYDHESEWVLESVLAPVGKEGATHVKSAEE